MPTRPEPTLNAADAASLDAPVLAKFPLLTITNPLVNLCEFGLID